MVLRSCSLPKMVFPGGHGHGQGARYGRFLRVMCASSRGSFIIGTDGRILFSHHASGPADHPSPDVLLDVLSRECAT